MIYLPRSKLYFVHIPKCAGQSVIRALLEPDEASLAPLATDLGLDEATILTDLAKGYMHPRLGHIHPGHLPLMTVKKELPHTWNAIRGSSIFGVTRNPRDRFISALLQRLKEFKDAGSIRADDPLVQNEASQICEWLQNQKGKPDSEYIHFTRQIDYLEIEGEEPAGQPHSIAFPMSDIEALEVWLKHQTGHAIKVHHDHARRQPKRWARILQPASRFAARKVLPPAIKRWLYPYWVGSRAFSNASNAYQSVDLAADVEDFLVSYYAKDFVLHESAKEFARKV